MLIALLLAALAAPPADAVTPADAVIEHARIWSAGRGGFAPFAAIVDGRFVAVGEPDERYLGPDTRRIDAGGRVVLPGLIDSHVHMLGGGASLEQLQLRDAGSRAEFVARVADWARRLTAAAPKAVEQTWITGGRWSTESWERVEQPVKGWVDPVTAGHPLYLPRMDGHSALVNSTALRLAGITGRTPPDPEGGVIDRDPATGEPTGILRESAMGLVARAIPPPTIEQKLEALRRAMHEANRRGITAVADIPDIDDLEVYQRLDERDLTVRLFLYPVAADWAAAAERVRSFAARPWRVQVNGLKTYLDGSLGSRTAYMREPYLGNPPGRESWRGLLREGVSRGRLARKFRASRDAGLQAIAHAIGDEANHLLLETLARVYGERLPAARCRSEHAQHLRPEDIGRFGALGVIASMQPLHKADDGRYAESYLGPARCHSSYAFRSLLDAGAVVVFGSDWPVVSINPFLGIDAAVTGRTLDGRPWQTQECITVGEALRSYTSRAAWALFAEDQIGRIERGYRADFIILDRSPFEPPVPWSRITPRAVYLEGRAAFTGGDGRG